jgi:hypothetical protein
LLAAGDVVAGADPVQRSQGLHRLLNAASFKFFTSLAGLALSISCTLAPPRSGSTPQAGAATVRPRRRGEGQARRERDRTLRRSRPGYPPLDWPPRPGSRATCPRTTRLPHGYS